MKLKFRTAASVAAAATVIGAVGLAAPAFAAQGTATLPAGSTGNNFSRPSFTVSNCDTATASQYNAVMSGPGAWSSPVTVLGTTPLPGTATFTKQLGDTFQGLADSNSKPLVAGLYTVTFQCLDGFGAQVASPATGDTGLRSALVNFSSPTAWAYVNSAAVGVAVSGAATAVVGSNVTLTATIDTAVPGTVQFKNGATNLGSAQTISSGTTASITVNSLAIGANSITAVFTPTNAAPPATQYTGSTSAAFTVNISKPTPSAVVAISPVAPSIYTPVTLTCNVTGGFSGPSSATFTYTLPGAASATTSAAVTLSGGSASLPLGLLSAGNLTAVSCASAADANNNAATSSTIASTTVESVDPNRVATEYVQVTVNPGALTLTVEGVPLGTTAKVGTPVSAPAGYPVVGNSTNVVILPNANVNASGDYIITSGNILPVKAVDTRAGDPGYTVTGLLGELVQPAGAAHPGAKINPSNFGWAPVFISSTRYADAAAASVAGLTAAAATPAANGLAAGAPSNLGLGGTAKNMYTAAPGAGTGTTVFGALLDMKAPTFTLDGFYEGVLTLTAGS